MNSCNRLKVYPWAQVPAPPPPTVFFPQAQQQHPAFSGVARLAKRVGACPAPGWELTDESLDHQWLLPFSCTLSPSPLPGDALHLSLARKFPWGQLSSFLLPVHMGQVAETRGRRGSKTPASPAIQTKGSRLPQTVGGWAHVAGPLTLLTHSFPLSSPR